MKKTLLFFAFALIAMASAQAQAPRLGIKAGLNYSGFEGDDSDGWERKLGFHAGLLASFPIVEDFFMIKPEILYSQKGARLEANDDYKLKMGYIDVPILGQINAGPLYFEAGPQFSVRVSEKIRSNDNTLEDNLDRLKRTTLGYAAGIGLASMPMGLSVGVRYNADFSKIFDDDNMKVRNGVFLLTLGYMFPSR